MNASEREWPRLEKPRGAQTSCVAAGYIKAGVGSQMGEREIGVQSGCVAARYKAGAGFGIADRAKRERGPEWRLCGCRYIKAGVGSGIADRGEKEKGDQSG